MSVNVYCGSLLGPLAQSAVLAAPFPLLLRLLRLRLLCYRLRLLGFKGASVNKFHTTLTSCTTRSIGLGMMSEAKSINFGAK
mmetsp:Transcript_38029/g.69368  ORF Transcript_38029/g.69368 Transcript_38029/m.69368 type:complete len:82 (-) Transcript_38029:21-266(-)